MRCAVATGVFVIAGTFMAACGDGSSRDSNRSSASNTLPPTVGNQLGGEEFGLTEEQLVTAIENVEARIASCMADAGFDYVPIEPVAFREAMDALTQPAALSDEEFLAQYGYGISTMPPVEEFRTGPDNAQIFDHLSSEDQVAYSRTLFGDDTEATFIVTLEDEDFATIGGCTKIGVESVFTPEQLDPTFQNQLDLRVEQDSRIIDAKQKWSGCMEEAGFDFEEPDDAEDDIADRLEALADGQDPATLTGAGADELAQLQGEELAIAAADIDCQEQFVDDVEQQVEQELSGRG